MKANKIVFSSIAALALASSAFGTASISYDFANSTTLKDWSELVQVSGKSIKDLGWDTGAISEIKTNIGAADAASSTSTIVGNLVKQTEKKTDGTTDNKAKFSYAELGDTITNNTSITKAKIFVTNNAKDYTSAGSEATLTNLLQDYSESQTMLVRATAAKELIKLLKNDATDITDATDLTSATFKLKTDDQANAKKVLDWALSASNDASAFLGSGAGAIIKANGEIDTDKLMTQVGKMFKATGSGNTSELNDFSAANKHGDKDIQAVISYITTAQGTINTKITELIDSSKEPDNARFVKRQLDDAMQTLANYEKTDLKVKLANARLSAVKAELVDTTNGGLKDIPNDYTNVKDADITSAKTKEAITQALREKLASIANTNSTGKLIVSGQTATEAANINPAEVTSDQYIDYSTLSGLKDETSKPSSLSTDHLALSYPTSETIKDENAQFAAFKADVATIVNAIDNGQKIDTEILAKINKVLTNNTGTANEKIHLTIDGTAVQNYNNAVAKIEGLSFVNFDEALKQEADAIKEFAATSAAATQAAQKVSEALGESLSKLASTDTAVSSAMDELKSLKVDDKGAPITYTSVTDAIGTEYDTINQTSTTLLQEYGIKTDGKSDEQITAELSKAIAAKYADAGLTYDESAKKFKQNGAEITLNQATMKTIAVDSHNAKLQKAANNVASAVANAKKDSLAVEGLSTLNIQLNNMNKRLGELRGMDGEIGVWLRTWGGKMSADHDSFKYYSTQLGADKKTSMKDGDLYLGVLVGYDNVKSDIKSNAYSVGAYASYIDNSGFFADGVMKFVSTKNERSGFDLSNQQTLLASIEGGYRFDLSDGFYVEPSLEFVTGHVGEYKSKEKGSETTLKVDSFTPVVFKPQVFVGGSADAFSYRAGVGGVLSMQGQDASVTIANVAQTLASTADGVKDVNGSSTVKLSKNNHGFASIGGSFKASENFRINLGVERSFGGDLTNDYEVNMTLRYGF